jgi:hypothetical protein
MQRLGGPHFQSSKYQCSLALFVQPQGSPVRPMLLHCSVTCHRHALWQMLVFDQAAVARLCCEVHCLLIGSLWACTHVIFDGCLEWMLPRSRFEASCEN